MTTLANAYDRIAVVDKQGSNVLFLDADSYVVQQRLNGFPPRLHELVIASAKMKGLRSLVRRRREWRQSASKTQNRRYRSGVAPLRVLSTSTLYNLPISAVLVIMGVLSLL